MATGTDVGGSWNTTAGNKTVTGTPAVGDLIVVIHGIGGWASGDDSTITDNNSDGLGTYHKIGTASAPLSTGGGTAMAAWISVRNAPIGSASSTVFTTTNTGDTGGGLTVLRFSGFSRFGSSAVKQSKGESTATENPPTITFGATTLTGNPVVLACFGEDNPLALTPPTGFTEADDTGWATSTSGIEVCWDDAGNTATLFSWSGGASTDHNEVGIELDASGWDVTTGLGELTITGYAPTVVLPAAGGFNAWTALWPYGFGKAGSTASPGVAALALTGYAPTAAATANQFTLPGVGALSLTGLAPAITTQFKVSTGLGALAITGFSPVALATDRKSVSTGLGALTLTGIAPAVSATANQFAAPGLGSLTIGGLAPALAVTDRKFVSAGFGALAITGYAPASAATANQFAAPGLGQLTITGNAPQVGANPNIAVGLASLTVTGYAPTLADSGIRYVRGGATYNGDGTSAAAASSPGGIGAYNTPPGASFASDIEWRLVAGTTLSMASTGLTTGNNVVITRTGTGDTPIILSSASTILDSTTATGVSISDIYIFRSGSVTGIGYNANQTTGTTLTRVAVLGSETNVSTNNAVTLTVTDCTLGSTSTEYGIRSASTTTTCSDWSITGTTFEGGIGISLIVSNSSNAAGKFTGLVIDGNTFPASVSSAIILQSAMNLTDWGNYIEVTGTTTIVRHSGPQAFPAWSAGQSIFLSGFSNISNYGPRTVVSIANDTPSAGKQTLTVSGTALVTEASGQGKGAWLVDSARCFDAPEISYNICTGQGETPFHFASIVGGRIHHNDISDAVATATDALAAAIELGGCSGSLVVDYNAIDNITLGSTQQVDGAGIFTDGGCDGVTVSNNTISNIYGRSGVDNSGQGTAFFFARNCTHDNNTITNCYRGTWAGGVAGGNNTISNNDYIDNDYGIKINCSPAPGAFDYSVGNTFSGNTVNIDSCPDSPKLTPGLGELTITGYAPQVGGNLAVTAGLGALALTGFAPSVSASVANGFGAWVGLWPYGFGKAEGQVSTGVASLVLASNRPTVANSGDVNFSVNPGLGQLVITGYTVRQTLTLPSPDPASLVITCYAPTLLIRLAVSPGLGQLTLTGLAPSVAATAKQFATAGLGQLAITGLAPSVQIVGTDQAASPGLAQLAITGYAPTVVGPIGQSTQASPGLASLTLTGFAPETRIPVRVSSGLASLTVTGLAPTINVTQSANPGVASLAITGLAPTVFVPKWVDTGTAQLAISGLAPTISATDHKWADAALAQLLIDCYAPSTKVASGPEVTTGLGSLEITCYEPGTIGGERMVTDDNSGGWPIPRHPPKRKKLSVTNLDVDADQVAVEMQADAVEMQALAPTTSQQLRRAQRREQQITEEIKALLDQQDALQANLVAADALLATQIEEEEAILLMLAMS